jgi:hypothetical protein
MIGRLPLWAMLVPLLVGVAAWALMWRSYADGLEADLRQVLPPGTEIATSGFPYRLEAHVTPLDLSHRDTALAARLKAGDVSVNRVPWQRDRQVLNLTDSVADIALTPLPAARARVAAAEAQASLRLEPERGQGGRIARLSAIWVQPAIATGLLPGPIKAARFEAHLRETPADSARPDPRSPRLPTQVQLVLDGTGVQFGAGDPLALALAAELTAGAPISSLRGWAKGGTAEIGSATLADATGEVARLSATLVPDGAGALRIAGTIETVCPANVRAALAGLPPVSERRVRKAEAIAFSGTLPGGVSAAARNPALPPAPVRAQQPPCPRLR